MEDVIKDGTLVFEINNGIKRAAPCKVNMKNRRVYGFSVKDMFNGVKLLNDEYLLIDGKMHGCTGTSNEWRTKTDYWYNDK